MTERQLLLLCGAEDRRKRRKRAAALIDANQAFAGGTDAAKHLKDLQR